MKILCLFTKQFVFGLWLGSTLAFFFAYIFDTGFPDQFKENMVGIFAVFATVAAAAISLSGPRSQINATAKAEKASIERKRYAARSFLPIALKELDGIANFAKPYAGKSSEELLEERSKKQFNTRTLLSERSERILKEALEVAAPNEGELITIILRKYQWALEFSEYLFDPATLQIRSIRGNAFLQWFELQSYISITHSFLGSDEPDAPPKVSVDDFNFPDNLILCMSFDDETRDYISMGLNRMSNEVRNADLRSIRERSGF